jgi:hypothetical protein
MIAATMIRLTDRLNRSNRLLAEALVFGRYFAVVLICLGGTVAAPRAIAGGDAGVSAPPAAMSQSALLAKTLATLNLSSPTADLEANLERQDLRFVGVNSYTCMAPGVGGADSVLPQQYGLRCLFGTSDFLESREHAELMTTARRYAARYNAELVRRIRRHR